MCAIVDANVASEVFGPTRTPAGDKFFGWINKRKNRLVLGGKLREELDVGSPKFREWASQAVRAGIVRIFDEYEVNARTKQIERKKIHTSDDPHILALAQLSGARLLYSNDAKLQQDFKNKDLLDHPQGNIYSTQRNQNFTRAHKRLLGKQDLCRT